MLFVKVDVQPLASGSARLGRGDPHKFSADPLPSLTRADDGVEDKGVRVTIPGHIDKPDQFPGISSNHPAETVRADLTCPIDLEDGVGKRFCMQGIQLLIVEITAPFDLVFCHEPNLSATRAAWAMSF